MQNCRYASDFLKISNIECNHTVFDKNRVYFSISVFFLSSEIGGRTEEKRKEKLRES